MGKATVTIPFVTWRGGKPRYVASPLHRRLGLKGADLRHADGRWFSLEECEAWSDKQTGLIEKLRAAPNARAAKAVLRTHSGYLTVAGLFAEWFRAPKMNGLETVEGKKRRKPLAFNSVEYYRQGARALEKLDEGEVWLSAAAAITPGIVSGVLNAIEIKHGLAAARRVRATLSAAFAWAKEAGTGGVKSNPVGEVDKTLPMLAPRIRYGSLEEIAQLVRAADLIGLPEIGDSVLLGVWTGQRQNDRLALPFDRISRDGIGFRQSKKSGQPLLIPEAWHLSRRLAAARLRRAAWAEDWPNVVVDERLKKPFSRRAYVDAFARVRATAVAGISGELAPMPSLADMHDQDLRDTAVTWLALAGADKFEIASITGHSLGSIDEILSHYLGLHPELARSAIAKLVAWHDGEQRESAS